MEEKGLWGRGLGAKVEGLSKEKPPRPRQPHGDYQREKGVWKEVEEDKRGLNDDGRRLDLGW